MHWFLRLPVVLILVGLSILSLAPAIAGGVAQLNLADLSPYSPELNTLARDATWLEIGLWAVAGLLFLIASVRLVLRTQAFWMWLLGFAAYGGRWALTQQEQGGLVATIQTLTPDSIRPENLTPESAPVQAGLLAFHLVVGLIVLILDAIDRAHWDRQAV